jgi:hypothetical protein
MDELHRAVKKEEMTVEQMLDRVGTLDRQFVLEMQESKRREREEQKVIDDDSLELDIDGHLSLLRKPRDVRPVTERANSMHKRIKETRDHIHSAGEEMPKTWSVR